MFILAIIWKVNNNILELLIFQGTEVLIQLERRDYNFKHVLYLGFSSNLSYKIFKHCSRTCVKTGLGNLVCWSHEVFEVEQIFR